MDLGEGGELGHGTWNPTLKLLHKSGQRSFTPQSSKLECLPMPTSVPSTRCSFKTVPLHVFMFEFVFVWASFGASSHCPYSIWSSMSHSTPKPLFIPSTP